MKDYKTLLQEELQKTGPREIVYQLVEEAGPAHDRSFEIRVQVDGQYLGSGVGKTKKAAEQLAAKVALEKSADDTER